jgi:hypothetical protein
MYSSDTKKTARLIVKESLPQILAGSFHIPSIEEMIPILQANQEYLFDEYKSKQEIIHSNKDWSERQVLDELEHLKIRYENELRVDLKVTALNIIEEIENLIKSLNQTIAEWKIKNL